MRRTDGRARVVASGAAGTLEFVASLVARVNDCCRLSRRQFARSIAAHPQLADGALRRGAG
jgi:hypothetical protein